MVFFVRKALDYGNRVTAFCRTISCASQFPDDLTVMTGDIGERTSIDRTFKDSDKEA